ncbi:Cerevisin [Arthrobotrys entomopaga]|nr:Cerevisin [Arthrobotrys entomopaga]
MSNLKDELDTFSPSSGRTTKTGSGMAGTIGSRAYGVAKKVNIYNCRVLDAQNRGNAAWYAQGLEAALRNHERRKKEVNFKGSVVNMSFAGESSRYFYNLIQRALNSGMHISASAGNFNSDACKTYPAAWSADMALISVGATDINDRRWELSNYGRCVTLHAPGHYIMSTYNRGPQ